MSKQYDYGEERKRKCLKMLNADIYLNSIRKLAESDNPLITEDYDHKDWECAFYDWQKNLDLVIKDYVDRMSKRRF
jgi:hypothetical protein